jgi:hypothetical protein
MKYDYDNESSIVLIRNYPDYESSIYKSSIYKSSIVIIGMG